MFPAQFPIESSLAVLAVVLRPQRREERLARRQENELKATVMQTISKTHKLKTMNKKQLRQIKKTQVNVQTGKVELVSPWQK